MNVILTSPFSKLCFHVINIEKYKSDFVCKRLTHLKRAFINSALFKYEYTFLSFYIRICLIVCICHKNRREFHKKNRGFLFRAPITEN